MILITSSFKIIPDKFETQKQWQKVERFVKKGQPKSALKIVDEIYEFAKVQNDTPQIIKSLIYRASLQSRFEEDHIVKSIKKLESQIKTAQTPEKEILQSLVAELYQAYYNTNRWTINSRQTVFDDNNTDINTWDAVRLNKEIEKLYIASLQNEKELSQISLKNYDAILLQADSANTALYPYFFDLIANRALNYFSSDDFEFTKRTPVNKLDCSKYLTPISDFTNLKINPKYSKEKLVLSIFQKLTLLHLRNNNTEALVDLELRRLKYVYGISSQSSEIKQEYINSLTLLAKKYNNHPVYAAIAFDLANQYYIMGNNYVIGVNKKNKYYFSISDSICNKVIEQFPNALGSNKCRNMIEQINQIDFRFEIPIAQSPNTAILSLVEFKNVEKLYFRIVKGDAMENANRHNKKENIQNQLRNESIISWEQDLPATSDHRSHTVEVKIPKLPLGYYIVFVSNDSLFSTTQTIKFKPISITNLSYITCENPDSNHTDIYILDRETGKSIGNVNVTIYTQHYDNRNRTYVTKQTGSLVADKTGYLKVESINNNNYGTFLFKFEKGDDKLFSENYLTFFRKTVVDKPKITTYLFTDRAIYRPGQSVYFKGIVTKELNSDINLLKDYIVDVEFINSSRKKINTVKFTTNQDGSFNGFFVIPTGGLNGQMTLKTKTGSVQVLVENYRIPTYEVIFDSLRGQAKLNEKITVSGNVESYAGNAVVSADVKYRVVRNIYYPIPFYRDYSWYPPITNNNKEITNGNVTTNSNGEFSIQFDAETDDMIPEKMEPVYTYNIITEVTDITGEVQAAETSIKIGKKSVVLSIDMPDIIELNNNSHHNISAKNLVGTDINFDAKVSIYKLTPPERLLVKRQWPNPEFNVIPKNEFIIDFPHLPIKNENNPINWERVTINEIDIAIDGVTKIPTSLFSELEKGEYLIIAKGKDSSGTPVDVMHIFTVYSYERKKMPGNMVNWLALSVKTAEPGQTIKLTIGSATRKSQAMYEVINGDNIISRQWIPLNKGQKTIEIPVVESYRGNFNINVVMVKFNRFYSQKNTIVVPFTNKKLDIVLETFRSHLTPGKKEEWNVNISGKDGQKISADLLAGMYDASLDNFRQNSWQLNLYKNKYYHNNWETNQFNSVLSSTLFMPELAYFPALNINYPSINWFGYQNLGYNNVLYDRMDYNYRKSAIATETMGMEVDNEIIPVSEQGSAVPQNVPEPENIKENNTIPLRTNFNETAFFHPNLKTDELGNVTFSFNTPDALTEWRIMMLAYTNDLKVGTLEQRIKSQKELMIIPNVPRFVRQGDTLLFTAKVINFTNKKINTESSIEFFDAITMKPASLVFNSSKKEIVKTIDPNQSIPVSWEIVISGDISMLAYRIVSSTDKYSDGEERMFPVLTNRMLVTNTLPMNVSGSSTTKFNFDGLSNLDSSSTIRNYKYTIEFTSNPSWYAVQALPYLSNPTNKNYMAIFNSYFANSLSSYIINSNPSIKPVFEAWKNLTPDAFLSNLEKNQELKNTVLNATPWVLDAENESEQKRRIALLFDVNNMSNAKESVLKSLYDGQLPSGAWPWFKGMKEDRYTTQSIVLGMAKLHSKGVLDLKSDNRRFQMIRKAVSWLDKRIVDDYTSLKKTNSKSLNKYHLRSSQIQYLYLRALLIEIIPIPDKSESAIYFYTNQAKRYWLKQSNYLQGMTAMALYKFGHRNESEAIIRSLKERSLYSKEMGMYWRQESGWNWYQAPVETQAMMIETMAELDNNPTIIEQLKIWLLKQKQTQHWNTSSATAESVYALLMYGNNVLNNNDLVDIKVGENTIDLSDETIEAGTGFFSTSWVGKKITNDLSDISITNPNNSIAWGAAYWQFFEDLDKIESHNSPLSIDKKLFIEKLTSNGPVLVAMESNQQLQLGDKVTVRIIISTDRNMEYIHLKDMRATTFEPVSPVSGYTYSGGLWYYKNITDVSTEFFMRYLNKGTYVLEYPLFVTQKGNFTNGIATIQSMYAPEFGANSEGLRLKVGE